MARPNKKYKGILSVPLPINPQREDFDIRIHALLDYYKIPSDSYIRRLHSLTYVLVSLNKLDINMGLKEIPLIYDKTATWERLTKSAQYFYIKIYNRLPKKDEYLEYVYKHSILNLANQLKIPGFIPTNLYALIRKKIKMTKSFLIYRDIMYLRKVCHMKEDEAISKYIEDNNLKFKPNVSGVDSLKRTYKEIKAKNKQVRRFYSMEYVEPVFNALKKENLIPQDAELTESALKIIGTLGILFTKGNEAYDELMKYAKKIKYNKNVKLFNHFEEYYYNKTLEFEKPPIFVNK